MRHRMCLNLLLLILTAVRFSAQEPSSYVGIWTGSWEGGGTGGFELTLEKAKEGGLTGRVSVTGEPTYKANLKTVSFDGAKMTATYDFPPDEHLEVLLVATFEGGRPKEPGRLAPKTVAPSWQAGPGRSRRYV